MFLTIEDFKTHLYRELIDNISRKDLTLLDDAMAAASGEAKGYLSRYNIEALFSAAGTDRDPTLLMYLKDMTVWHFIVLGNPDTDIDFREARYNSAISWLKNIQSGKVAPFGWPPAEAETQSSFFHISSNPKRGTSY